MCCIRCCTVSWHNFAGESKLAAAQERLTEYYLNMVESPDIDDKVEEALGQINAVFLRVKEVNPPMTTLFADALMAYFERRGLWANIVPLAEAAADAARDDGNLMREVTYLSDLGYALHTLARYEEALTAFERNLEMARQLGDPATEASALNNIGAIYERQGRYDRAREHYEQSLNLREMIGSKQEVVDALNNIAGVYYWLKAYDEAITTFQRWSGDV